MKNTTILIVDDVQINREILREMLGREYQILEAKDGEQAVEILKEKQDQIHLVLLDVVMPGMDGFDVLDVMNEEKWIGHIPVIMISVDTSTKTMVRAYELGATDYITRPFDFHVVNHRVRNTLLIYKKNREISLELDAANQRYFDTFVDANLGVISKLDLNITQDFCQYRGGDCQRLKEWGASQTISGILDHAVPYFSSTKDALDFCKVFNRDALLKAYEEGQREVSYVHGYYVTDDEEQILKTSVHMTKTAKTDEVIGIMYSLNVSEIYIKDQLNQHLYDKVYESIGIIRAKEQTITIQHIVNNKQNQITPMVNLDYKDCCKMAAKDLVLEDDRELFLANSGLEHLKYMLSINDEYFFFVRQQYDDKVWLKKHSFYYLDGRKNLIVSTIEDFTNEKQIDVLTGEYNLDGFIQKATHILRQAEKEERFAILYLNIQGFKAINTIFTTSGADALIRSVPIRLRGSFLKPAVVARAESDHYICLVKQENLSLAQLTDFLKQKFVYNKMSMDLQWHCGIYIIEDMNADVGNMCGMAKLAESYIDNGYLKPFSIFSQEMQQLYVDKSQFLGRLATAIEKEEFKVYYQPIYDGKTKKIVSAEALVRWNDPQKGLVAPSVFIPMLEESGYVSRVDEYVEKSVRKFQESRYQMRKKIVPVSVNLSRVDFYDEELVKTLLQELDEITIPKKYIKYEITESCYAAVVENGNQLLNKFKELGLEILLDDFGSGYSSFSTLRDYQFDIMKLDMGFVQQVGKNEKSKQVIQSLIDMAHQIGMRVVAEGAEEQIHVDLLCDYGCDMIQGFYYSKPLPEDQFVELLEKES